MSMIEENTAESLLVAKVMILWCDRLLSVIKGYLSCLVLSCLVLYWLDLTWLILVVYVIIIIRWHSWSEYQLYEGDVRTVAVQVGMQTTQLLNQLAVRMDGADDRSHIDLPCLFICLFACLLAGNERHSRQRSFVSLHGELLWSCPRTLVSFVVCVLWKFSFSSDSLRRHYC